MGSSEYRYLQPGDTVKIVNLLHPYKHAIGTVVEHYSDPKSFAGRVKINIDNTIVDCYSVETTLLTKVEDSH